MSLVERAEPNRRARRVVIIGGALAVTSACTLVDLSRLDEGEQANGGGASKTTTNATGDVATGQTSPSSVSATAATDASTSQAGPTPASSGSAMPMPPYDWAPALSAVWRFDTLDLGSDDSPNGHDLVPAGTVSAVSPGQQGASAATVSNGGRLVSTELGFGADASNGFTLGGWFRTTAVESGAIMGRMDATDGYLVEALPGVQSAKCYWLTAGAIVLVTAPDGSAPNGQWHHFVCRYEAQSTQVSAILGGATVATGFTPLGVATTLFGISPEILPFNGEVDEVFFHQGALSDAAIRRIFACGIDGAACTCDPTNTALYESCGRAASCNELPPCDLAMP